MTDTDQATEQSVTDRVASKFGFPAKDAVVEQTPEETLTAETTETSDLAELSWDGKTFQVPVKLKEAFMRNEDYTRKTQEIAAERRSLDHLKELAQQGQLERVFSETIATESQELSVIDAYLQQASKMDWSQMTTDQMLRHKVEVDQIKERRDAIKTSIDGKRSKFNDDLKARISELRGKAREFASKSINGFSEETEKAMKAFAVAEGLTEAEVDNVLLDPRSYRLVWKAMQFDKVQAGTTQAAEKATKASPVLKPGAAGERMPAKTADRLNLGKGLKSAKTSGEKANVIEDYLARGMFSKGHT